MGSLEDGSGVPSPGHKTTSRFHLYRALLRVTQDPFYSQLFPATRHLVAEALGHQAVLDDDPGFAHQIPNEPMDDEVPEHIRFAQMDSDLGE